MADLPTTDDLLNQAGGAHVPTTDELLSEARQGIPSASGGAADHWFSNSSYGKVLNAFGQGFNQGWGNTPDISKDANDWLTQHKVYNDYKNNRTSVFGGFNEAILRPLVATADTLYKTVAGTVIGTGSGLEQAAKETNKAGLNVQTPYGPLGVSTVLGGTGEIAGSRLERADGVNMGDATIRSAGDGLTFKEPSNLVVSARAEGAIGEPESSYFGTKEPSPSQVSERNEALGQTEAEPKIPSVNDIARSYNPEAFQARDEAQDNIQYYRDQLQKLAEGKTTNPEHEALTNQISTILSKVKGNEERLTQAAADRLAQARAQLDVTPERVDTEEMATARQNLQFWDKKLRDVSLTTSKAFRDAQEAHPEAVETTGTEVPNEPEQPSTTLLGAPEGTQSIADDVASKLKQSGRPVDEAEATGKLVEQYYNTRTSRTQGKLGSGLDLYNKESPEVQYHDTEGDNRRGYISVVQGAKNTIHLFRDSDSSTFMHEMGHQWLEDLQSDAAHPEASAEVSVDHQIVRDWLKAKDGQAITQKQHEKWARGVERYLREGVAPSKELASVFAKFKNWLVKIYKTVRALNTPINDDIRDVFSRMLSTDPSYDYKTVISPEIESVVDKEPEGFDPTGDNTGADFTKPKQEQPKAEESVDPYSATLGKDSDPSSEVTYDQTKYLSKSGEVFLDNLTSDEDVKNYTRDYFRLNREFFNTRKGKLSHDDILSAADAVGQSPRKMAASISRLNKISADDKIPLAARIIALKHALVQSSKDLIKLSKEDNAAAFADASIKHLNLSRTLMAVRTEWGRAGFAFKTLAEEASKAEKLNEYLQSSVGKTFDQVKADMEAMSQMDTPKKVSQLVRDQAKSSWGDYGLEYMRNNYLTGPITHATYSVANKLFAVYKAIPETLAKALVTKVQPLLSDQPVSRVYAREAWEGTKTLFGEYSMMWGSREGFKAAKSTFLKGEIASLPGEGTMYDLSWRRAKNKGLQPGTPEFDAELTKYKDHLTAKLAVNQAQLEGLSGEDFIKRVTELKKDYDKAKTFEKPSSIWTKTKHIPGLTGDVVRSPGERFVGPIHAYDRAIGFEVSRTQLITRQALDEGHRGSNLAKRIAELRDDTPEGIMAQARDDAWEQALMGSHGDFTRRYQALLGFRPAGIPVFGFIEPFVSVTLQIGKSALIDRGILGLGSKRIRDDLIGKNGSYAQADTSAKMGLGLATSAAISSLVFEGSVNPGADPDWRKQTVAEMWQGLPHSFTIGNMSYSFEKLGVLGLMMSTGADLAASAKLGYDTDDWKAASLLALYSLKENGKEFYEGFSSLFEAIDDADHKGTQYVNNLLSSLIPGSVGLQQVTKSVVDPYQREAHGLIDQIKAKIPFWSETLEPKVDLFGQPILNKEFVGVYAEQVKNDPVYKAFKELGMFPAPVKKTINGVQLTDHQYFEYATKAGLLAKTNLNNTVAMPGWESMSPKIKHDLLNADITSSRQVAAATVMMGSVGSDNDILHLSLKAKMDLTK